MKQMFVFVLMVMLAVPAYTQEPLDPLFLRGRWGGRIEEKAGVDKAGKDVYKPPYEMSWSVVRLVEGEHAASATYPGTHCTSEFTFVHYLEETFVFLEVSTSKPRCGHSTLRVKFIERNKAHVEFWSPGARIPAAKGILRRIVPVEKPIGQ